MTLTADSSLTAQTDTAAATVERAPVAKHYLMCPPIFFDVTYSINPWMDPSTPVDTDRALAQWNILRATYERLGHRVDLIEPVEGLPDMVYAANGGTIIDGKALTARFHHAERQPESIAYRNWFSSAGLQDLGLANHDNEGEGDFLVVGDVVFAGTGFRSTPQAHAELAAALNRPVISLQLVDPRFYHLDTALAVLSDNEIAYYPGAFDEASQRVLESRFPGAIIVGEREAEAFALNAVSDGRNVMVNSKATHFMAQLRDRGYVPIGIDMSELIKGGGSVKCCTLEVRR